MADNRIHAPKSKIIHSRESSNSFNYNNKVSSRDLSIARCVRKTSLSRRHRSLQIKHQRIPIHQLELENTPRISVRPVRNSARLIERNESFRSVPSQYSIGSIKLRSQSKNVKENREESRSLEKQSFNTPSKCSYADNHRQNNRSASHMVQHQEEYINHGIAHKKQKKISHSHEKNRTDKYDTKSKKKRKRCGGYCCSCKPFYIFLMSVAVALILSAIAALLIALIKPQSTSTKTTTSTTATTTTSTSTSTTTTSMTSTTTTTARPLIVITRAGDPIMGLYNTSASQSTGASNGIYSGPSEIPNKAIDGNPSTKYLNFGFQGITGAVLNGPGVNTGFYVIPTISNATIATALLFATANDFPSRDPITVTLEGTNATTVAVLNLGSSWTLIYSGSTGIHPTIAPTRSTYVTQQNFSNTIAFRAYRLLVTSQRNLTDCVQYGESRILGYA